MFQHGALLSGEADGGDGKVDQLDADERHDQPADAIDEQVALQQRGAAWRGR